MPHCSWNDLQTQNINYPFGWPEECGPEMERKFQLWWIPDWCSFMEWTNKELITQEFCWQDRSVIHMTSDFCSAFMTICITLHPLMSHRCDQFCLTMVPFGGSSMRPGLVTLWWQFHAPKMRWDWFLLLVLNVTWSWTSIMIQKQFVTIKKLENPLWAKIKKIYPVPTKSCKNTCVVLFSKVLQSNYMYM